MFLVAIKNKNMYFFKLKSLNKPLYIFIGTYIKKIFSEFLGHINLNPIIIIIIKIN